MPELEAAVGLDVLAVAGLNAALSVDQTVKMKSLLNVLLGLILLVVSHTAQVEVIVYASQLLSVLLKKLRVCCRVTFTLHLLHQGQSLQIILLRLFWDTHCEIADADVFVGVNNYFRVGSINFLLDLFKPLPELKGFKVALGCSLEDGKISDGLLQEWVVLAELNIL